MEKIGIVGAGLMGSEIALVFALAGHDVLLADRSEAEVSAAICFLLSPGAAFITGVTLAIDGGAPLDTPLFPIADHSRSAPFDGFHRGVTPDVLKED